MCRMHIDRRGLSGNGAVQRDGLRPGPSEASGRMLITAIINTRGFPGQVGPDFALDSGTPVRTLWPRA